MGIRFSDRLLWRRRCTRHTKADAVMHVAYGDITAPRRPATDRFSTPAAAANCTINAAIRTNWIGLRGGIINRIPIVDPFTKVPAHVVGADRTRAIDRLHGTMWVDIDAVVPADGSSLRLEKQIQGIGIITQSSHRRH